MNHFHFRWKCGREEGTEQIERGKVIEWEKKLREEAKNGRAGEARHWGRACLYCWEEKGILDTNYSCADATPHLMRRVRSYLKDDIKAETEKKKRCEPSRVVCNRGAVIIRYGIWHYIWGALLLRRWSLMKKEKKTKCIQSIFQKTLRSFIKTLSLGFCPFFFPVLTYARWDRQVLHLTVFKNLNDARGL